MENGLKTTQNALAARLLRFRVVKASQPQLDEVIALLRVSEP
jgi:hypothetical protein